MLIKKISVALLLALFLTQCDGKGNHSSNDQNLLLLAAITPKDPGISGLFASINAMRAGGGGGGGAGAYSNAGISPLAQISQSQPCPKGGNFSIDGDLNASVVGTDTRLQFTATKFTYANCSVYAPKIDNATDQSSSQVTLDGEIVEDIDMTQSAFVRTGNDVTFTTSGTSRLRSSNYKVNGYLFPTFDVTFTYNNTKYTFENAIDLDNAYVVIEETVHASGTIGTETVNSDYSYKVRYKFR
ncbi:sigma factor SigX-regulated lipoprotein [Leptospira stimsonii]|uniref:Lipoprotein n=1 Tax=Leptospira stimsonii TaxID=2202203 RepID=A0A396YWJ3_9LEPT|nr:hypothetical protein [Leptospira stimsonii]RHX85707.1 hypothetical protein DLM75_19440 [Leptospira stimsonii]